MPNEEDLQIFADWYKAIPDDFKKYVAFRVERVDDKEFATIYEIFKMAEKACKIVKKVSR